VDDGRRPGDRLPGNHARDVSILVLVDDGRRRWQLATTSLPCTSVSILVLVDDGRRLLLARGLCTMHYEFQSLFLWMTDVDLPSFADGQYFNKVSILVLVDDGRRPHHAPKLYQGLEFRVNLIGSNRASGPRIGLDLGVQASRARNFGSSESLFS